MFNFSFSSRRSVGRVLLVLWIVFSVLYILNDQFHRFQEVQLEAAYQRGVADSVLSLLEKSENCQPVTVYAKDQQVELLSLECLSESQSGSQ